MEICSQDKCIIGSESQVLLDRGCLVDINSIMRLQLFPRLINSDTKRYIHTSLCRIWHSLPIEVLVKIGPDNIVRKKVGGNE